MIRKLCVIAAVATLAACATPPAQYQVENTRTYPISYDQTWEKIVYFFASHNIPIKNIAKDSGVIYAEATRFDDSVADCGKPGLWQVSGRTAQYNVFVNRSGTNPTVSVNTDFKEIRRFQASVETVECSSRGVLERAVLASIN